MANTYFQFKQFTIHQEHCAMKVSTEACILGSWIPAHNPNRILDIGTGTGLLAIMLAQRIESPIDAVEVEEKAFQQAIQNVNESPWSDRITLYCDDIVKYAQQTNHQYDMIVSNPPFFTNNFLPGSKSEILARHDTFNLNKKTLTTLLAGLLTEDGSAYILYPEHESREFRDAADQAGLYTRQALIVRNQPEGAVFRVISEVSKSRKLQNSEELIIRTGSEYSPGFILLLRDYYLK